MSATCALHRTVLAHELGHTFGVVGHNTSPWYKVNTDLIRSVLNPIINSGKHTTSTDKKIENITAIYKS